ncbi:MULTISPECIES: serine hydrolase domain-containing protein [unclassified Brevundimonas]|uniref:serine hydrolase domain-containing protein n=1 Tax=unclassified Brevundimonas TaxID=2622653 RepID=UPI003F8DA9F7
MFVKRVLLAAVSAALILAAPAQAQEGAVQDLSPRLTEALAGTDVPGTAVLTIRNGVVVGEGVAGVRDLDSRAPAAIGDVWHLGSDGKAISATVIARLVDQGVLSWTAPLETMLPDLAAAMRPEYRQATLVDLLSHRAGLPDIIGLDETLAFFDDPRPLPEQRRAYAAVAVTQPAEVEPRTVQHYSNGGYILAAAIAEQATGKPFEQLTVEQVLRPLGMTTAAFGPTEPGQPLGHEGGRPLTGPRADNPAVLAPAGELHMSLQDWALFAVDQVEGETGKGKLLSAESYRRLHRPEGDSGSALGWGARGDFAKMPGRFLTHVGSNGYWNAMIVVRLDNRSAILTVANGGDDTEAAALNLKVLRMLAAETLGD